MESLKQCSKCKELKPETEFYKRGERLYSWCKDCMKMKALNYYYQQNRDDTNRKRRNRYANPEIKERILAQNRQYYHKNKTNPEYREKRIKWKRKYRSRPDVRDKELLAMNEYRSRPEVSERRINYSRQYFGRPDVIKKKQEYLSLIATKNKFRRNWQQYHARKLKAPGQYTIEQWNQLCKLAEYKCLACGGQYPLTVDHIIPLTREGCNCIHNIQPLCKFCNCSKNNHHNTDYRTLVIFQWLETIPHNH